MPLTQTPLRWLNLFLLPIFFQLIITQDLNTAAPSPPSMPDPPTQPTDLHPDILPPLSTASYTSTPTPTDNTNYANNPDTTTGDTDSQPNNGVLNYYFLLAVVIILIVVAYWILSRRRQNRAARSRGSQRNTLEMDVHAGAPNGRVSPGDRTGRPFGVSRWRRHGHESRPEEGLDERGEAPPPYLAKPEPTHQTLSGGIEQDEAAKLPGYEVGGLSEQGGTASSTRGAS